MADDIVMMSHGSGGLMMKQIIDDVFLQEFDSDPNEQGDDAFTAQLTLEPGSRIAMSTDTFVVTPRFFPGGNIGRLAVCGTVNDVATSGAEVLYLSCGFVLEEGLPLSELREICATMAQTAREAGVRIVTGDTKVVEKGSCDGLYINTAGFGIIRSDRVDNKKAFANNEGTHNNDKNTSYSPLSGRNCKPGDKILVSGNLGDHGIAIISTRKGLNFQTQIESDAAPLNHMIAAVLKAAPNTRCFRDPTRGGLASTLNEFASQSGTQLVVHESSVPVAKQVKGCCEMLGYDVFQVANEGKLVAIVAPEQADAALSAMKAQCYGENAAIIGEVTACEDGCKPRVLVESDFGSHRIMDMLVGEQLPRIC